MNDITRHRDSDGGSFYCDNNISLGNTRLSTVNFSENARPPIWNEDNTKCIILNGAIYNFQELRSELLNKNHIFRSKSTAEIILHLYEEEKERTPEYLNGIFAFAIYDKTKNEIFLARDRIGVKPLYYYFEPLKIKFIFSSEVKAILAHDVPRRIDLEGLALYFKIFFVPSPHTLFFGIKKLPPAHYLVFRQNRIFIKRYWGIEDQSELNSPKEIKERIKFLLRDSVKRQLISDRPVGIFLSGGIDSSSILGMVAEVHSGGIKTFSTGFEIKIEEEKFNRDFYIARQTSQCYKTDHHEILISDSDARDNIEKVIWHMEEPISNPAQISTFLVAQEAKNDVAIVLGGDGGDEIFGGYSRYYYSKLIDRYQFFPAFLRKGILPYFLELIFKKKGLKEKLNTPPGVSRYLLHMSQKAEILSRVLSREFNQHFAEKFLKERYPENKFRDKSKYLMYLDLFTWLPDESLARSDKMTRVWGLEQRMPILDHRLVEFAFKIPTKYKIRGRKSWKWIFKEAMKDYLPSHLLDKEKRGWFSPAAKWLRLGMKEFAYEVLSPRFCSGTKDFFDFKAVQKILDDHICGKKYNLDIIWSLLTFQIWYKTFIES